MSSRRPPLFAIPLVLVLACGGEELAAPAAPAVPEAAATAPDEPAPEAAPAPEPAAPTPGQPTITRSIGPDGKVFEAQFRKDGELPSDFPEDVPLYGNARPLSSMSSPQHGSIVNLRSSDPPENVFAWYRDQYAEQGWTIEVAKQERGRRTVVARKGNRVSSVVITALPGATQTILSVLDEN